MSLRAAAAAALLLVVAGCAGLQGARLYVRGTQELERGQVELAISDLERAAERVPQASEIQNHLGLAYAAAGRWEDALRAFERAVALDCSNAAAAANLRWAERSAARAVGEDPR